MLTRTRIAGRDAPRSAQRRPAARRRVRSPIGLVAALLLAVAGPAFAADNTATGDIAGDAAALTDSDTFVLNGSGAPLTLVKRAFLEDGTPVPNASTVPGGTVLKFMIYISNASAVTIHDVSVQDVLDPGFVYVAGSLQADNSAASCATPVCDAASEAGVFTAVAAAPFLADVASGADVASYTAGSTTVDAGRASQPNARLDIAGARVWALLFSARVQ